MTQVYILTYAQNATPIHPDTWASLLNIATRREAKLGVVAGRYKNPTSVFHSKEEGTEWWATEVEPYLCRRHEICDNLTFFGDISIQATAKRPLLGMEAFCGRASAIFGAPKRQLQVVPTGKDVPRVMWSTGACTVANYTDTKLGKHGDMHHALGGVIVEVADDGLFFVRHLSTSADGSIADLDRRYWPDGRVTKNRPEAIVFGDWHEEQRDPIDDETTKSLMQTLRPNYVFLHDVLDFRTRNHHHRTIYDRYPLACGEVWREIDKAAAGLRRVQSWLPKAEIVVVRSNHDEALERWVSEFVARDDLINAPYWHELSARAYAHYNEHGKWPNLFEMEARRLGVREQVRFLWLDESCVVAGIEHGFHGHKGPNGARASAFSYARMGVKVSIGHTHTPFWLDGACGAGLSARLHQGYNTHPSTWMKADIVEHADGKRQIVFNFNGRWRA